MTLFTVSLVYCYFASMESNHINGKPSKNSKESLYVSKLSVVCKNKSLGYLFPPPFKNVWFQVSRGQV